MITNTVTRPFKLIIEMQENKGIEVYDDIICNNLAKIAATKKSKPCDFTGEAKNLIRNNAICRKEELGDMNIQDSEHAYPSFAIR